MNIYVLDNDPRLAAAYQCDKHVVKMTVETAQLLSTSHHLLGGDGPYKPTHANHPCAVWTRGSAENYEWTFELFAYLLAEYTRRYGKSHACARHLAALRSLPPGLASNGLTDFVQCMPEHYRIEGDAVAAYKAYYLGDKSVFAKWKMGEPAWWLEALQK